MDLLQVFLAGLIPLFVAAWEDAKERMVSVSWIVLLVLVGLLRGFLFPDLFSLAFAFLIVVLVRLRPKLLPQGDVGILLGLSLLFGVLLIPILGLSILFVLVWNLVKRRPFNSPVPLVPFLFVGSALVFCNLLVSLL